MIDKILGSSAEDKDVGMLANDLLKPFAEGFPKENVKQLIASPNPVARGVAAFLMTFWGFELHPMISDITTLLDDEGSRTCFDTIEVLLTCTTPEDGEILGRVLLLLDGKHEGIRWKVAQFVSLAQPWQLRLALNHAVESRPDSSFKLIGPILGHWLSPTREKIQQLIGHPDPLVRRFGAALAVRPRLVIDESFLDMADQSSDLEVKAISKSGREGFMTPSYAVFSSAICSG